MKLTVDFLKNRKIRIWFLPAAVLVLFACFLFGKAESMSSELTEQQMAERWSKDGGVSHVSCFFSANAQISTDRIEEFEYSLDQYLKESSIEMNSENPSARLWVDSYSADGRITLSNGKTNLEADAMGVGGDFFLFHPQKLLGGSYFSGSDLNSDYCIIDEEAAWQLFGSSDVVGMMVYISGIPHIVSGVIQRPDDKMLQAAGLDSTRVYVSYHTLAMYGNNHGISHYEVVMPNPVKEFAFKYVKEKLGSDENESEVIENSSRFQLLNRLKCLRNFTTRSMNGKAIIYPYWENLARGYEDIISMLTFLAFLCLVYPVILCVVTGIRIWKHKNWTFKGGCLMIRDKLEKVQEKRRRRKRKEEEDLL